MVLDTVLVQNCSVLRVANAELPWWQEAGVINVSLPSLPASTLLAAEQ